ncbi:MAG: hypothetical protein KGK01_00595 [Bradyrhizobium sp.]|nr:hypothetical protein [Bradyrhizobium sp.]
MSGSFFVCSAIRILNIVPVQDILAANEVLDRKYSEGQEGEQEHKNRWCHFFAFTNRALCAS